MKRKIFRWKAIGPLLLFFSLLFVLWLVFGDLLVEDTSEEVTTELLGTQVDISGLRLLETEARVELARLQIADPFNLDRNLLETGSAILKLDPAALLEKKLVVDQLTITDLRFGTRRESPARAISGGGFAPTLLREVRRWSSQFDVPLLKLTPLDTVRTLVLDPSQLGTIKAARAVVGSADSVRTAFTQSLAALDLQTPLDSARALVERLANANPRTLGVAGTRQAIQSVRRTITELDEAKGRVRDLELSAERGLSTVRAGVATLDDARQRDYAFARSLLQLPSFDAPDIGSALFGPVSVDRFEQAVYWAKLAQGHLPPGLRPSTRPAPQRLRMDGTTVTYPRARSYPSFLLRDGKINVRFEAFGGDHALTATASGLTSEPAVYGQPSFIASSGTIGGAHPMTLAATAVLNHLGSTPHDSAQLRLDGVPLPSFNLPGLPFRLAPGAGNSHLVFDLRGNQVAARWTLRADNASWSVDSSSAKMGTLETLIWRVLSGLDRLEVTAELAGSLQAPRFTVRSNLDEAIAERIQGLLGEEVRAAEARVRARVDSLVGETMQQARDQVDRLTADLRTRITGARGQLDTRKAELENRLKSLTGGLGGVLGMRRREEVSDTR